ncbi:MAG: restriction endonuclease [Bacilli bacterium]|nr:restriction endonuclease [Bacilli bacterium]
MTRKGRNFELAYKWLYELDKEKYRVVSPAMVYDKVTGRKREVDNLIEFKDSNDNLRKISVECRDRKNKEDVMWLEQLKTKREDLELDFIIAITTSKFTEGAIKKARYHGIIIEEAEYLDKNLLDNVSKEFLVDFFFLNFKVLDLKFIVGNKIISFKELFQKLSMVEQFELMSYLNQDFYYSINPHEILNDKNFDIKKFFDYENNSFILQNFNVWFEKDPPKIIKNLNIKRMYISIKMIPFKLTLPLNKSLSVFDVKPRKNKKYSAFFGTDDEYLQIGYLNDGILYNTLNLKIRKYYRLISANMNINTIFPEKLNVKALKIDDFLKYYGEFDLSEVF